MASKSQEELSEIFTKLENTLPDFQNVENNLWKTTAQCSVLLKEGTATTKPITITGTARRFTPDTLFYLDSIDFHGDNLEKIRSSLTVVVKPVGKPSHTAKIRIANTSSVKFCYILEKSFCEWFEIYSDSKIFKPKLTKVDICGVDIKQLESYAEDMDSVTKLKYQIEKIKSETKSEHDKLIQDSAVLKTKYEELSSKYESAASNLDEIEKEITDIKENYKTENEKYKEIKFESSIISKRTEDAKNNLSQLEETSDSINKKISTLNSELRSLTENKNLISDEYGPYVKEGKSQARIYAAIVLLPILAILFSVYELYQGASKILTTEHTSTIEIVGSFILRIPFAAVFGLAIYYSWRLTSTIIQKIFTIHSDRLTLAKLLVLARETTHSAAKNLDISNETIFKEQVKLKVDILKSHLSRDLGNNFEYTPEINEKKSKNTSADIQAVNDPEVVDAEEEQKK